MRTLKAHTIKLAGVVLGALLLLLCVIASMMLGVNHVDRHTVWKSIVNYDENIAEHVIIRTTRVPRALIAAAIGASLAIAGTLMQALTRNPLASPSVLGINAGATCLVVLGAVVLAVDNMQALMWISIIGATVGAGSVYVLGSLGRGGLTPLKIVLAGAAMTALFSSMTQGMLVLNKQGLSTVLFWLTGSIAGRSPEMLATVIPYMLVGWVAAYVLAKDLNLLVMDEGAAKGLGQRTLLIKLAVGVIVVVLAGCSVAVAGPIGFIGIVIPHIARYVIGLNHRWLIPYSAIMGAILLISADVAARFIMIPEEVPVGVMTAIIGGPFFVYLARRGLIKS